MAKSVWSNADDPEMIEKMRDARMRMVASMTSHLEEKMFGPVYPPPKDATERERMIWGSAKKEY